MVSEETLLSELHDLGYSVPESLSLDAYTREYIHTAITFAREVSDDAE